MIVRRPLVAFLVLVVAALGATACGDDSSSSSSAACFDKPTTPAISPDSLKSSAAKGTSHVANAANASADVCADFLRARWFKRQDGAQ